ncbi:MAG: transcriptional regulator [Thaumarchaeota archaeon]|nr:transcriptional regulator [Nitrososphaerota archaeon]MBI3641440.1 transcriptional regulator [Nitrososphaerota archaeon]
MSGLDTLIAKSLDLTIKESLGKKTLQEVEQRLYERYGINVTQSIKEFHKLDSVLKEFFGERTEGLEKKFLGNIVTIESKTQNPRWITIKDLSLAKLVLETLGDRDNNNILNTVIDEPRIISEILETLKMPQTSGYRKINSLIDKGLVITQGYIIYDGKKVNKYKSIFGNVRINIKKNKVIVQVQLAKELLNNSSVIQVVCGVGDSK